jgi:mono/diheme cytochrome c family protein
MKMPVLILGGVLLVSSAFSRAAKQAPDGKALYDDNCKKCHGVIGNPPKTMKTKYPKNATFNEEFVASRSDDSVVKILTRGKGEDMKSFKDKMTLDEMMAVAKYVRQLGTKPGS